jgi:lysophospholipase L1-like esterase
MPLTIACYGDSTLYGYTTNGRVGGPQPGADGTVSEQVAMPAPDALQTLLQMTRPDVTVQNFGREGMTCEYYLNGTTGVPMPWKAEMALSRAQWVLILLCINDEPAELALNYPQLVDIAEAAGKRVIIQTPNTLDLPPWGDMTAKLANLHAVHAAHPTSILIDFYAYTQAMGKAWLDQLAYSELFGAWAGIHPTQVGYDTMAAVERDVLQPIIEAMAP